MHGGVEAVETIFLLLLAAVSGIALLARKLDIPYPIVLVLAGLALAFVPGMPRVALEPDVVFLVVLPPLLYAAAWQTSWREFRYNLVSISLLAFGLVGFLVFAVAALAPRFLPGFDWRTGFVLGAVVATTDAIAATTIARRLGLPQRIVDVLEGESLVNDATGLLALELGTALVVAGRQPAVGEGAALLLWLTLGGVSVGLLVGLLFAWVERRIEDGPVEITLGLLVPYATYLAAEAVHASGVLAVVACGLWLSRRSAQFFSASVRLQAWAVWDALIFMLNGLVFMLIGLQLPAVLAALREHSPGELAVFGLGFSLLLIVLRLVWTFPMAHVAWLIRRRLLGQPERRPPLRQIFVVGWTGMRGVVALAAALALPTRLADGSPFPQRDLILFLTFAAILVTLVGQGLTLPPLIRALGLAGQSGPDCEEHDARQLMVEAALDHLTARREQDTPAFDGVYDDLAQHYRHELAVLRGDGNEQDGTSEAHHARHRALSHELLRVERQTAVRLRDEGRINDEVLRRLVRDLDLGEERLHTSR